MINHHSTYIDALIHRTESLLDSVRSHLSGNEGIQKTYTLDYLCANLVEQIQRMERLRLSDLNARKLSTGFSALLEEKKFEIVKNAIKGAEPDSLRSMFESALRFAPQMLQGQQTADAEPELYDQLVDCLVKRDDLFLIEQFIRRYAAEFNEDDEKNIRDLFSRFTESLSTIDKAFKEQIEIFALVEKFCRRYISSNHLTDEELYWWLHEPIHKAEEAGIISAVSLLDMLPKDNTPNYEVVDAAAAINANVRFQRLMIEEKNKKREEQGKTLSESYQSQAEAVFEPPGEYSSKPVAGRDVRLIPGVYAFTVNSKTTRVDHCLLTGMIDAKPTHPNYSTKYLDHAALQIISGIPAIAGAIHSLQQKDFTVELSLSPDGWCGVSIGLPAYFEYLRLLKYLLIARPIVAAGIIDAGGKIHRVEEIQQKVERAIVAGFEIIVIPRENKRELHRALQHHKAVIFAGTLQEAVRSLEEYKTR